MVALGLDDAAKARDYLSTAYRTRINVLGELSPDVASSLNHLALLDISLKKLDDATERIEVAVETCRSCGAPADLYYECVATKARIAMSEGDHENAEKLYSSAIGFYSAARSRAHPELCSLLRGYATAMRSHGREREAAIAEAEAELIYSANVQGGLQE